MAQTAQLKTFSAIENEAQRVFVIQREAYLQMPFPSYEHRIALLDTIERILIDNADAIAAAINRDYGCRSTVETKIFEVFGCIDTIRYNKKHLRAWMKPQKRHVGLMYATGKNRVIPQPKGVVGIVSPWNYPLFLAISPLANALAAGNRCMVKLAANSKHLCELLAKKFREKIPEDTVAILPGVRAQDFSALPFDHICFTGSANAGKDVMRAAAENLTPVTLELGGKSPTIVCDDFNIQTAAERILFGKFINAGQTCVAPDYLFIPESRRDEFVAAAKRILTKRFPNIADGSYSSVIDMKAFQRLRAAMDDATAKGAKVISLVEGAGIDESIRRIPPHIVLDPNEDMIVLQEEIFGPLLPVMTYRNLDDVIAYINRRDRPLGLYLFTHAAKVQQKVLYSTISGGVTINNVMFHVTQHDMPFGGSGASGMGHYHGHEGFVEFSKLRPVFTHPKVSTTHMLYPPYGRLHARMFDWLVRFIK